MNKNFVTRIVALQQYKIKLNTLCLTALLSIACQGASAQPEPIRCINSQFSAAGKVSGKNVTLKLTNNCGKAIDFQDVTIAFQSKTALNTTCWGDFSSLPYPNNNLSLRSERQSENNFLAILTLHFPTYPNTSTKLPPNGFIQIKYSVASDDHEGNAYVYLKKS